MIRINLAPPSPERTDPSLSGDSGINLGLAFSVFFVAMVTLLVGYWWKVSSDISRINNEIDRAETEKTRLAAIIAEGQRSKRDREELESRVNAIERIGRDQARPVHLMDALADVLPSDLWLSRIEEKRQQLRLAGTTYSAVALSDFMSNLKGSAKFKDVDLVESRQDLSKVPRTITFEVSCRFEI